MVRLAKSFLLILVVLALAGMPALAHAQSTNVPLQLVKQWCLFNGPVDVALDGVGDVFVADSWNGVVKEIYANGSMVIRDCGFPDNIAGNIGPAGVAVDTAGNIYITDTVNNMVREIYTNGTIVQIGYGLLSPQGIAVDSAGDVFVADSMGNTVVEIYPNNSTVTIGGFTAPQDVAVDAQGNVYVVDATAVKKICVNGTTITLNEVPPGPEAPQYLAIDSSGNLYLTYP